MTEPITCVPSPAVIIPAATPAAEPLLEPPGVRRRSCGLRVPRGSVAANSGVTVLPTMTAPASGSANTLAASRAGRARPQHARGIGLGALAREQGRAVLSRHVDGLDDVLDPNRHAVDL